MDTLKIGEYIQRLRREKGLTQENLSERLSVTRRPSPTGSGARRCRTRRFCPTWP